MKSSLPARSEPAKTVFRKVAQNLYRLDSSGVYYALFKRSGKQIRKSLKTTDHALAKRRLNELAAKVSRLNQSKDAACMTFEELGGRWLDRQKVALKEKSITINSVHVFFSESLRQRQRHADFVSMHFKLRTWFVDAGL